MRCGIRNDEENRVRVAVLPATAAVHVSQALSKIVSTKRFRNARAEGAIYYSQGQRPWMWIIFKCRAL